MFLLLILIICIILLISSVPTSINRDNNIVTGANEVNSITDNSIDNLIDRLSDKYEPQHTRFIQFLQIEADSDSVIVDDLVRDIIEKKNIKNLSKFEKTIGLNEYALYNGPQQIYAQKKQSPLTRDELSVDNNTIINRIEKL